jgi:hypothetical protein
MQTRVVQRQNRGVELRVDKKKLGKHLEDAVGRRRSIDEVRDKICVRGARPPRLKENGSEL